MSYKEGDQFRWLKSDSQNSMSFLIKNFNFYEFKNIFSAFARQANSLFLKQIAVKIK